VILVVDIGSSSVRASRWDDKATPIGEPAKIDQERAAEFDADTLLDIAARALDGVEMGDVTAVATSTMWHCLLGLDADGRPITPVYSYADARSAPHAAQLRERLDERAVHARTGCRLHSSYWPAKLAWLQDTQPDTFARVRTWVSPGEYIQRRLLGDAAASVSMASGTGLLDQASCQWHLELAEELGVEDKLPPIDDAPRSGLTGEWAERWPALRDAPWFPAWGDGACSNLGAGCDTRDRSALMIGTSGALRVCDRADPPSPPPALWCYRADVERILLGGSLSDGGSVVAWLRETQPDLMERVRTWISPGEYVQRRLLGDATASISMASGTGLLDHRTCTWDEELTRGVEDRLPPIDDTPRSGLTSEWAERWPGLREVPWFPAWGDGACSNLGSGCGTLERAALMVGTSGALRVLWRTEEMPEITRGLWRYRADAKRVVIGGSLSDGGSVFAWLKRLTRLPEDAAETERAIAAMSPDAHGLTVLPLLSGERGPGWSDAAGATIAGLTPATEPLDLLRAALEAVALRFRLIALELREALPGERIVVGTGGGLVKSPAWTQIMADALGREVAMSQVEEGSSRGAALLALEALGHIERAEEVDAPLGETYEPDPDRTEAYRGAQERQAALYDAVTSMPAPQPPEGPAPVR